MTPCSARRSGPAAGWPTPSATSPTARRSGGRRPPSWGPWDTISVTRATAEKTASDLTTSHVGRHFIQPDADGHYRIGGLWPWEEWPTEENDTDGSPATTASSDVPWQNLADALNALVDAGQFPHFHDLYGARNDW
ncbi:hypothetical protein [Streptomyces spiralis]|uniref:hypothetical protein n=1 Tax=Streptomyces spiralis TaxID=66376 RepID=UPI0033D323AA